MGTEASGKKSFLIYFDAFPCLEGLSMEQRGQLFTALFQYAIDAARSERSPLEALDRLDGLAPETRMAFLFLAGNVFRDTAAWRKKKENCARAAQRRSSRPPSPQTAGGRKEEDLSWMREFIRRRDRDVEDPPRRREDAGDAQGPDR